jgi:Purple acid Phosphatase, N-terminal domain/Calcineurin-like phosphoesterase
MPDATNAQNVIPPESDAGSSPPRAAGEHAANNLGTGGQVTGGRWTGGPGGHAPGSGPSRRQVLAGAGGVGLLVAARPGSRGRAKPLGAPRGTSGDGTPEQVHLTWGQEPATSVNVSWASSGAAEGARVVLDIDGKTVSLHAQQRTYTDGLNDETVYTYHAQLYGLRPGTRYSYAVTADNDSHRAQPLRASFKTAPYGRQPFRFTSFGDLATANTQWVLSYGQAAYAVAAVESFKPDFHLLNGDLCYADLNPASQPEVWADFGNNNQSSAANRPWMPAPGNHEIEFYNGPQGYDSYLTRYALPDNGVPGFCGRWYSFQVGSALFISLDANDVVNQDSGPWVAGPTPLTPAPSTGNPPIEPGTSFYLRGYSGGAQTQWLERTLEQARRDPFIDWIVVQMHQCIASSAYYGNGSDLGLREKWSPLFDHYEVDLVVNGHDHDYERSFPTRGFDSMVGWEFATGKPAQTRRPHPVTTTPASAYDTSKGTVHLVLGGGGTDDDTDDYGVDAKNGLPQAQIFTHPNRPKPTGTPNVYERGYANAGEDAIWSAMRDPATGYGIGVFDVDPGRYPGDRTSIKYSYYHALNADPKNPNTGAKGAPNPDYTLLETVTFYRPRSDR